VTDDCSQICECTTTGAVCRTKTCGDNEICTVYETKRDCYKSELLIEITLKAFLSMNMDILAQNTLDKYIMPSLRPFLQIIVDF